MNPPSFKKRYVVYRRVAELFLASIVLSAITIILNVSELVLKRNHIFIMIMFFAAVFTFINFTNLRNCYFDLRNKKLFYTLNFLSQAIFLGINLFFLIFEKNKIYTWLFAVTKALKFIDINIVYSVLIFHLIQMVCIVVSPIGMGWIFEEIAEDEL